MYASGGDDTSTRLIMCTRYADNYIRIDEEPPCLVQRGIWLVLSRRAKLIPICSVAYYKTTRVRVAIPPDDNRTQNRRVKRHRNWATWFG